MRSPESLVAAVFGKCVLDACVTVSSACALCSSTNWQDGNYRRRLFYTLPCKWYACISSRCRECVHVRFTIVFSDSIHVYRPIIVRAYGVVIMSEFQNRLP